MEQEWQNDAGALTAQAIPQKDVEQACFHALGLVGRNCEYLEQHLARVGADEQTRQAVNDISAAAARLDRTMNEVMTLLDFLRAEEPPQLSPLDLCQMLQQIAAQADMVQEQLDVELTLDYGGLTSCRVMGDCSDAELLCLHLLSNALRACGTGGKVQLTLRRCENFWKLTVLDDGCGLPETSIEQLIVAIITFYPIHHIQRKVFADCTHNLITLFVLVNKFPLKGRSNVQLAAITNNTVFGTVHISCYNITNRDFVQFNFHSCSPAFVVLILWHIIACHLV